MMKTKTAIVLALCVTAATWLAIFLYAMLR
jgi:hypothetical protein